ncbi:MAG TPA: NmrA family NAD(P)-binding protein [Gemmatimonadales bacterium]|nr:NmrA family NAD(P)-binding protein [Gemmatimonadales bacterium]
MKVLVLGGTGTVGSATVKGLLAKKVDVTVLTRNANAAGKLPAGVKGIAGDLLDIGVIRSAFKGFDAAYILTALHDSEAHQGLLAVNGAVMGGVKKIVFLSIHDVDKAPHLPHFGAKIPIELAIKASGVPYTILRPNNFYQNDYWFKDVILNYGIYPQPFGSAGLSRVDVEDIAEAGVLALTSNVTDNETVDLVGPEAMTAPKTAEIWSKALGKTIKYGGDDLDAWEKSMLAYMPAWQVFDFRMMYHFFQTKGLKATPQSIARQTKLLGHAPRAYEPFVEATAKSWK